MTTTTIPAVPSDLSEDDVKAFVLPNEGHTVDIGALLVGIPAVSVRGVVLVARTAGLVAHLTEEAEHPIGMPLWLEVERRSSGEEQP